MVESTACSFREVEFDFQHPHESSQLSVTPGPGNPMLFLTSEGTRHAYGTQTYMQGKYSYTKFKKYIYMKKKWHEGSI